MSTQLFEPGDALLIVDVQNDFCPGGALAVPEGDSVVPVLNQWIAQAQASGRPIIASRDWHPVDHVSFAHRGGPWPEHCVQDTPGAAFHPNLHLPKDAVRVSKGTAFDRDAYSAFDQTGLAEWLRYRGIDGVWVGGLAMDVCVEATLRDACAQGLRVRLIRNATRAVDPDKADPLVEDLQGLGTEIYEGDAW